MFCSMGLKNLNGNASDATKLWSPKKSWPYHQNLIIIGGLDSAVSLWVALVGGHLGEMTVGPLTKHQLFENVFDKSNVNLSVLYGLRILYNFV